jgi:hypothetical protein
MSKGKISLISIFLLLVVGNHPILGYAEMFCDSDVLCFFVRNLLVSNLTETHHWLIFCTGNGGYVPTFELAEWEWWTRSKHFKTICPKVGVHTNCISSVVPVVSHRAPPRMPFIPNVTMGGKTHPQRVGWLLGVSHEFGVDTAQGRLVNTAEGQTHSFRIRIVIKVGPNEYVADAGCDSMTSKKTYFVALVNSNIWAAIAILCKPSSFSKLTVEDF